MSNEKGYERIQELTDSLKQAMGRLQEGKLGLDDLEQCTTEARQLYERLVVLRHKLREAAVAPVVKQAARKEGLVEPGTVAGPMRLDTRPAETPVHQTSLIDAIAETEVLPVKPVKPNNAKPAVPKPENVEKPEKADAPETEEPKAGTPKPVQKAESLFEAKSEPTPGPKSKPTPAVAPVKRAAVAEEKPVTVADKLEHAPVADLRKAIALSQKFWFVAELFGGERDRYEKAIDALNGMDGFGPANTFLQNEVLAKLPKAPGEVAETFTELLKRRFKA